MSNAHNMGNSIKVAYATLELPQDTDMKHRVMWIRCREHSEAKLNMFSNQYATRIIRQEITACLSVVLRLMRYMCVIEK